MTRYSVGRVVAGSVLALAAAALFPVLLAAAPILLVTPVFLSFLLAWAGPVAFLIGAASSLCVAYALGGTGFAGISLLALIAPAAANALIIRRGMRFFRALRLSVVAQTAGVVLALGLCCLITRSDVADAIANALRAALSSLPAGYADRVAEQFALAGFVRPGVSLDEIFSVYVSALRLTLPSMVLTSSLTSGILGYAWPVFIKLRRGDEPPVSMAPLGEWRLTPQMIVGLPACVAVSMILEGFAVRGADALSYATINLTVYAFVVQAAGAMARRFKQAGMPRGRRALLIALMLVFARSVMALMGVYSAVFGTKGLVTAAIKRRAEKKDKGEE